MFDDLIELVNKPLSANYHPMTTVEFHASNIDDIIAYAEEIGGQWNGDDAGIKEDRAMQASDILETCYKLKELLKDMDEL